MDSHIKPASITKPGDSGGGILKHPRSRDCKELQKNDLSEMIKQIR